MIFHLFVPHNEALGDIKVKNDKDVQQHASGNFDTVSTKTYKVPTGQGKTGKSHGICVVRERSGKILLLKSQKKVRKIELGSCRLQISVIFCISKY